MKGTEHFKRTIQMFLEQRAAEDELFAKSYRNPAKNIDDCVTYILNYVQKSGCNGFSDGEIYGRQTDTMSSSCKPCGGTDRRGKAGSKEKGGCPISADGTPKATEPQQNGSEKRNTSPTLII